MLIPTAEDQVKFLSNIQRVLSEGDFVATYKYALLLSLADIAVDHGDDSGSVLTVTTDAIAKKFITYYWRQAIPFVPRSDIRNASGILLRQNHGKPPAILRMIQKAHQQYNGKLSKLQRQQRDWARLVHLVAGVVRVMPLWKLQTVGRQPLEFLYPNTGSGHAIELKPGVVYCLRKFHEMIADMVRGAWLRYIRHYNATELGSNIDLEEFLFGTEREDLTVIRPVLRDLQAGTCFYCTRQIDAKAAVDHFVPWSMFPLNLGHNLVLAHHTCNSAKSDRLACQHHLEHWHERNVTQGKTLQDECGRLGITVDLPATNRIAEWAYRRTYENQGLTWHHGKALEVITDLSTYEEERGV